MPQQKVPRLRGWGVLVVNPVSPVAREEQARGRYFVHLDINPQHQYVAWSGKNHAEAWNELSHFLQFYDEMFPPR